MRTIRTLTAATLLALASCGSAKPHAAEPTTTTTTTAVATTTTAAATATTTTTVVATTTAVALTTTTAATDQTAAIKQAVLDYETTRLACLSDPPTCDPSTFSRGALLEAAQAFVARVVGLKVRSKLNTSDPSYWVLGDVAIGADGRTAKLQGCRWDTNILEGPGGAVFNDDKASMHTTIDLVLEDGRWWLSGIFNDLPLDPKNDCGPRQ
jgi:hypothetical protein